jgi:hypothetical protein
MRRASTSRPRATAVVQRAPAGSEQLVDELYRGHALRLTRMALLLVGDQPSASDAPGSGRYKVVRLARTCIMSRLRTVAEAVATGPGLLLALTPQPGRAA